MAIQQIRENVGGDEERLTATYYVFEDSKPAVSITRTQAVTAAVAQFFADYAIAAADYTDRQVSDHSWRVDVSNEPFSIQSPEPPATGTAEYQFLFRQGSKVITTAPAVEAMAAGPPIAAIALDKRSGLLNYKVDSRTGIAAPNTVTVPSGSTTDRIIYQYSQPTIPVSYRGDVQSVLGMTNDAPYLGWPIECLRLVEVTSSVRTAQDQTVTFGFAGIPQYDFAEGDLKFTNVPGWHYCWALTGTRIATAPSGSVYESDMEEIWRHRLIPTADFSILNLPTF